MSLLNRLLVCVSLVGATDAFALPGYISLVPTDQACATCHVDPSGGGARNAFGAQYESFGFFDRRWPMLCTLDADGDGFTNGEELGDPDCEWQLLTPPPGAVSNPSDPTSLPSEAPREDDDEIDEEGNSSIPSRTSNSIPGIPGGNTSEDDESEDSDDVIDVDAESDGDANSDMNTDPFNQETDDSGEANGVSADPRGTTEMPQSNQSQLVPIDPTEESENEMAPRAPLGSAQPVAFVAQNESESDANSGCSVNSQTGSTSWVFLIVASLALGFRRRRS